MCHLHEYKTNALLCIYLYLILFVMLHRKNSKRDMENSLKFYANYNNELQKLKLIFQTIFATHCNKNSNQQCWKEARKKTIQQNLNVIAVEQTN